MSECATVELWGRVFSGLLSTLMRDMANLTTDGPRWIVLDGDIDPMWIESLNTVMDDNKVCAEGMPGGGEERRGGV